MFGGKTALAIAIENCAWLERPLVVLGCDAERVCRAVPHAAQVVLNRGWRRGQITSLPPRAKTNSRQCRFPDLSDGSSLLKRKTIQQTGPLRSRLARNRRRLPYRARKSLWPPGHRFRETVHGVLQVQKRARRDLSSSSSSAGHRSPNARHFHRFRYAGVLPAVSS